MIILIVVANQKVRAFRFVAALKIFIPKNKGLRAAIHQKKIRADTRDTRR